MDRRLPNREPSGRIKLDHMSFRAARGFAGIPIAQFTVMDRDGAEVVLYLKPDELRHLAMACDAMAAWTENTENPAVTSCAVDIR